MTASVGNLGGRPYVEIDGVPFPLVEGSKLQRSPMNPFSPATQAGNSSRITDARLAVQVWDNFTGGLGQRDEEALDTNSYSEGNFDTRVAGASGLPPLAVNLFTTTFSEADLPVYVERMRGGPTATTLFMWSKTTATGYRQWRNNVLTSGTPGQIRGFAGFNNSYWHLRGSGSDTILHRTVDAGGTWTTAATFTGKTYCCLTVVDNRLVAYNGTDNTFHFTVDVTGVSWQVLPGNFLLNPGESVRELLPWLAPSGVRDTIFAVTNQRIMGYEEEAEEWHEMWSFEGVFDATYPTAHVFRRDSNFYMSPFDHTGTDNNAAVMMFTPGTSDEVGPTKRFGLPAGMMKGAFRLQGGIHWLYGFASGSPGGLYSLNEFQGWTMLFDARMFDAAGSVVGGGYAAGKGWVLTNNGKLYELMLPDRRELPPRSDGTTYESHEAYLRSSWTTHNQKNRWKIGAYFEVDMRRGDGTSGLPIGSDVSFHYRVDNGVWVDIDLGNPPENELVGLLLMQSVKPDTTTWPVIITLPDNTDQLGVAYKRIQWEIRMRRSTPATDTPVLASVALYYTFWQENHYAYQFNVDLSHESWASYSDETFGPYTRDQLTEILLGFNDQKVYHTFRYASGPLEEYIEAVDILVASREDGDMGAGIFSVTVRDLEAH